MLHSLVQLMPDSVFRGGKILVVAGSYVSYGSLVEGDPRLIRNLPLKYFYNKKCINIDT